MMLKPAAPNSRQHYSFDHSRDRVILRWPAIEPDMAIVRSTVEEMLTDPAMKSGYSVLSDWRQATKLPAPNYVHSFINFLETLRPRGLRRWATVVAAESDGAFGVGRQIEAYAELGGMKYRVFRQYDDALAWLDGGR